MQDLNAGQQQEQIVCDILVGRYNCRKATRTDVVFAHKMTSRNQIMKYQRMYGDIVAKDVFDGLHYIELKTDGSAYRTGNLFLETFSDTGERTGNVTDGWMRAQDSNCRITHYIFKLKHRESHSIIVRYPDLVEWYNNNQDRFRTVGMSYDQEQKNRSTGLLAPINVVLKEIPSCHIIDLTELKK